MSPFRSALSRAASCRALLKDEKAIVMLAPDILLQLTHLLAAESELWLPCLHVAEHSSRSTALVTRLVVLAFHARPATISLYMQAARNGCIRTVCGSPACQQQASAIKCIRQQLATRQSGRCCSETHTALKNGPADGSGRRDLGHVRQQPLV